MFPAAALSIRRTAPEPAQERDWCGDGATGGRASRRLGGVAEVVVVGGSVEVGDVLLGEDVGESGIHCGASFRRVVRAL
jgi:hypothetical protein